MLQLRTLGPLELTEAGAPVLRGRRKVLALLCYLARQGDRGVGSERAALAALLWPESDETRARQSLRQALSELRGFLGPCLEPEAPLVRLPPDTLLVDVFEFEADLDGGRLESAVARWEGDFLAGLEDLGGEEWRAWLEAERAGLRRRLLWALERLQRGAAAQGQWEAAVAWADRWRLVDAESETPWSLLIQSLATAGRPAEAVARHAEFTERLRGEGKAASREFLRLRDQVQTQPLLRDARGLLTPEFVGREETLTGLAVVWESVRAGRGRVVVIEGADGSGKSRLCQEFVRRVRAGPEARILEARAFASDRERAGSTVGVLLAQLAGLPGLSAAPPDVLAALSALAGELRERFPGLRPGREPTGQDLRRALGEVAAELPLLLLVDDAWEADGASLALLAEVVRRPPPGVMILLAGRPELRAEHSLSSDLRQAGGEVERITLGPLDLAATTSLLASVAPIAPETLPALAARLQQEAAGAPGILLDLTQQLVEAGTLITDPAGRWVLAGPLEHVLPLARHTRQATLGRFARLSADARRLAEAAAVLGPRVELALLEPLAALPPDRFRAALGELLVRRLLRPSDPGGAGFAFAGPGEHRVVYELLAPSQRRRLHRAAARVYGASPDREERRLAARHRGLGSGVRRRRLGVLAGIALAGAGLLLVARFQSAAAPPAGERRLLVAAFANETGDSTLNPLGRIAADWLSQGIARTGLVPVAPPLMQGDTAPAGAGRVGGLTTRLMQLARDAQADLLVSGSYFRHTDSLYFQASVTSVRDEKLLQTIGPLGASPGNPFPGIDSLRRRTIAALAPWLDARLAAAAAVQGTPPSFEAYRVFAEGLDYFYQRKGPPALERFLRAYGLDSSYAAPLVYAIWVHEGANRFASIDSLLRILVPRRQELAPYDRHAVDFQVARLKGDWAGQYAAARAAAQLAPQSFVAAYSLPRAARSLNRPREALEYLGRIDPDRGEASRLPGYWAQLSEALHMAGRYQRQLEVAGEVRRRFPDDIRAYGYGIQAAAALGLTRRLDALLEESRQLRADSLWGAPALGLYIVAFNELHAHGNPEHANRVLQSGIHFARGLPAFLQSVPMHRYELAELLYRAGLLGEARAILEGLLSGTPAAGASEIDIRARIGMIAALQHDSGTAADVDRWLQTSGGPYGFGQATEYRAGIQALLGQREAAVRLLNQAMAEGRAYDSGKHNYPEYAGLRDYPAFREWLRPKD